ncbi:hypothetical protein B0H10DRAFT_2227793 [Mycena sp. CBHHK59/15]|nr:hypothetical protein B0H10DRAFT_2227793 [Mycena sp. CBHHK59/15]
MRYGPDDPTLWPQAYSSAFCHLGAIPKKPTSEKKIKEHGIMWWDPTPADFVSLDTGRSIIRGLGKLSTPQFSRLAQPTNTLIEEYKVYAKSIPPPGKVISLFPALVQTLSLGLERLQTLPSTYSKMVLGVTNLQRAYLELRGLLSYMTIYKPRMEDPDAVSALPDGCVGVYTSDPTVAQQFRITRLPYWFIRPMLAFKHENILSIATPLDPAAELQLEPAVGYPVITVGATTEDKMRALHLCTHNTPWYKDPFKSCETEGSTSQTPEQGRSNPHPQHTGAGELPEVGPSQQRGSGDHGRLDNQRGGKKGGGGKRYSPCKSEYKRRESNGGVFCEDQPRVTYRDIGLPRPPRIAES